MVEPADPKKKPTLIVCGTPSLEPGEYGTPPIMVDPDRWCDECQARHEFEKCPKCGSWIHVGFGLMFGGFGEYKFCLNESCDWRWKKVWADDES